VASGRAGTVGGGEDNTASGDLAATVAGGRNNTASESESTVGGGLTNMATAAHSVVGGGFSNTASGEHAGIGGGGFNTASSQSATVPGGEGNTATGDVSFAAGRRAKANQNCTFVWADSTIADFTSDSLGANSFHARVSGGARFVNSAGTGVQLAAGGNAWAPVSDRAAKEDFAPVDGAEILERLATLPIETWKLRGQEPSIRHMGPMAQDFYAAFGLGESDRPISTVDADGVALAAIQGLYHLVQVQAAHLTAQQGQIAALEARLAVLEAAPE
jgi:hypothetical protein